MQTALDKNNGPTKWEAVAALHGAKEVQSPVTHTPDEDADETYDWSYLLSLAQSRREQATQKLKEVDEQLQVHVDIKMFSHILTVAFRILGSSSSSNSSSAAPGRCALRLTNLSALI